MWYLWWTNGHWDRFLSEYPGFSLTSLNQYFIVMCIFSQLFSEGQAGESWEFLIEPMVFRYRCYLTENTSRMLFVLFLEDWCGGFLEWKQNNKHVSQSFHRIYLNPFLSLFPYNVVRKYLWLAAATNVSVVHRTDDRSRYVYSIGGVITDKRKQTYSGKNLSHFHFAHHKSHTECLGREPAHLRWVFINRLPRPRSSVQFSAESVSSALRLRNSRLRKTDEWQLYKLKTTKRQRHKWWWKED